MTPNSSVNLKLIHFLRWIKVSHLSPNFETFEYSGGNLRSSLYHFPNRKSMFLQILYRSSATLKITPLYFFSSNITYFNHKDPIKKQIFETIKRLGKSLSNYSCQFWNSKSVPLQILNHSSLSWYISVRYILSSKFSTLGKIIQSKSQFWHF